MVLLLPPQTLNKLIMLTGPGEEIWHGIIIINLINLKRKISSAKPSNQNLFEIVKAKQNRGYNSSSPLGNKCRFKNSKRRILVDRKAHLLMYSGFFAMLITGGGPSTSG